MGNIEIVPIGWCCPKCRVVNCPSAQACSYCLSEKVEATTNRQESFRGWIGYRPVTSEQESRMTFIESLFVEAYENIYRLVGGDRWMRYDENIKGAICQDCGVPYRDKHRAYCDVVRMWEFMKSTEGEYNKIVSRVILGTELGEIDQEK